MDIKNFSKWTDDQVFAKTGKRLDSLHKFILEGVLQNQDYHQITATHDGNYHYDHIKTEGAKLWKLLSKVFNENIKQSNVRSILENKTSSTINNSGNCSQQIINSDNNRINICHEKPQSLEDTQQRSPSSSTQTPIIDLKPTLELNYNYGRNSEIADLKKWILENKTRLITIYGLSGIGKTALIMKLINEIQTNFDYIIYRSLDNIPQLITLKDDFNKIFSRSQPDPLPELIDYFHNYRCLVILDDVQNIFETGKLPSQYLNEYQDYGKFFKQIVTSCHRSCLILISWEKHPEIETLESEYTQHTNTLPLKGLGNDAKEILRAKGLKDEDQWDELINLYQSHPHWLNIIASTIINFYEGIVSAFIKDEDELFLGHIQINLKAHLERLSELEKQVINWLASQDQPIDFGQKPANLELAQAKFEYVIQSLISRCLVEKISINNRIKFQLNPVFKALYL
jgi:ATPase domain predominantly from Archaea